MAAGRGDGGGVAAAGGRTAGDDHSLPSAIREQQAVRPRRSRADSSYRASSSTWSGGQRNSTGSLPQGGVATGIDAGSAETGAADRSWWTGSRRNWTASVGWRRRLAEPTAAMVELVRARRDQQRVSRLMRISDEGPRAWTPRGGCPRASPIGDVGGLQIQIRRLHSFGSQI